MGRANEIGVDARRPWPGARVLAEFREVTGERLAPLRTLTGPDLAAPVTTPAGPGTMADLLTLRVMDSWMHEQDIRRATGRPGHVDGPAAGEAVGYFTRFLPYVVGKRAAAPDGSKVVFRIGGRGSLATDDGGATVGLAIPVTTFAALAGGRSDVPDDARITGDEALGRRVLGSLGLMP